MLVGLYCCSSEKKTLHIFFNNLLWQGNTVFTKMPGFAKMNIAEDKRLLLFPKNTFAAGEKKSILMDTIWNNMRHEWRR